jgi:hypothetical protein
MGKGYLSDIKNTVRQLLRDELEETTAEFDSDELDRHIGQCLIEISQVNPYEVQESVDSDGTQEISLALIGGLIKDRIVRVEYPVGNDPPSYLEFERFGSTLRVKDTTPTSGEAIYLYCQKVHEVTEVSTSLAADLEGVLVKGVVAYAALAWLNKMREKIVASSAILYQAWAKDQLILYRDALNSITASQVWEY